MRTALLLVLFAGPFAAMAHHSPASFDQTVFSAIEGTVTEYNWGNPHVYFAVETTNRNGERFVQQVEAGPASQLMPRGVTRELLRPGDRVTIRANPNRRGAGHIVLGVELTKADGSRFPLHVRALTSLGVDEASAATIEGTWVPQPENFLGLFAAMRDWPITEQARAVLRGDRAALLAAQTECIPIGPPGLMVDSVPITVSVTNNAVTFDIDRGQTRRVVHLRGEHPIDVAPTLLGHSVGFWDGTVLVVDTIGFNSNPEGMGLAFPSSTAKHTVERFSLGADRKHLEYEIVVEDSVYLTAPVTYRTRWDYRPGQTPSNAACDPAVARRFLSEE